jgi:agmatinase
MTKPKKTAALFFPFDCFGSAGTARGAELLADAVREMLADNRDEQMPARGHSYTPHIQVTEFPLATETDLAKWRSQGASIIRKSLAGPKRLIWSTGNHLGVLPLYDELVSTAKETLVIQFDAHLDIYNLTDCESHPSHGNYLMHCAGPLPRIINLGSRDLMLPADHVRNYYDQVFTACRIARDPDGAVAAVVESAKSAKRLVLDLDCDVFDPAFFPATLNPLPFGLAPAFLLRILEEIGPERFEIVAISEFAPSRDRDDQSLGTLLWLIEWLFLRWYELRPAPTES